MSELEAQLLDLLGQVALLGLAGGAGWLAPEAAAWIRRLLWG